MRYIKSFRERIKHPSTSCLKILKCVDWKVVLEGRRRRDTRDVALAIAA